MKQENVPQNLTGSCVVILGAGGGIGFEVASYLASMGAKLLLFTKTHNQDFLSKVKNLDPGSSHILGVHGLDFENQNSIQDAIRIINGMEITPNALVVASGVSSGSIFQMTRFAELRQVFDINFFGPLQVIQGIFRQMQKNKQGSIVFISSVAGMDPKRGNISYGTSKAALNFAAQVLSIEAANSNLRVNAVAPGLVNTKMLGDMDPEAMQEMLKETSLGRPAESLEIAQLIGFLISDMSSQITGQIIRIDGGRK